MEKETNSLVCVWCFTYNQSQYIDKTLNGFCMQQTTFPFVCVIVDDASIDGEQRVIDNYLGKHFNLDDVDIIRREETNDYNMVFARHSENNNCYFAVYYLKYNHYSIKKSKKEYLAEWHNFKYFALCEGDDYWIDPLKLQKQVDFLEDHPDYGLVHTNRYNIKGDTLTKVKARDNYDAISVLLQTGIATLTTCFRSDLYFKYLEEVQPQNKGWLMGDSPLWKYISFKSKIHLLPDYTAVYRILLESASHSGDINKRLAFIRSQLAIQEFIYDQYAKKDDISGKLHYMIKSNHHFRMFIIYIGFREYKTAWNYIKKNRREIKIWDFLKISQIRTIVSAVVCAPWHAEKK